MTDPEYSRYEQMSWAAVAAMQSLAEHATALAAREVEVASSDGRVLVRATAGAVTAITFRRGATRHYDSVTLGELVTRTVRAAQLRAREEYEREVQAAIPDEVGEVDQVIRNSVRY